jgi:DNA-3-methyladenine glycosylase
MLNAAFYERDDVVQIAQDLLGKALFSTIDGVLTGGIIVETESYRGAEDKASHAYKNRRTKRTETLFRSGGIAYVYTCYGIHQLLNVVTGPIDTPHAVLIRAIFPTHGLDVIAKRRGKSAADKTLVQGPGKVCQALAVKKEHNGCSFNQHPLWIEDAPLSIPKEVIQAGPRIGIDYAEEHALLPWRFYMKDLQFKKQTLIHKWYFS